MATRRPRVRTIGALIANGRKHNRRNRRNRRNKGVAYRLGKGLVRKNRRNRGKVAYRLGKGLVRKNRRNRRNGRSKSKLPKLAFARMNRRNGYHKKNRRNRRNGTKKGMYRKTARRAFMNRRNRGWQLKSRRNGSVAAPVAKLVRPIPLVGKTLAKSVLYAPTALGAFVGAEAGLQMSAVYAMLPSNAVTDWLRSLSVPAHFALVGLVGGGFAAAGAALIPFTPVRRAAQGIGLAFTSGAWGVAWYEFRKAQALAAAGVPDAVEQAGASTGEPTGALGAVMVGATPMGAVMIGADSSLGGMGPAYTVGPQGYGAVIVGG